MDIIRNNNIHFPENVIHREDESFNAAYLLFCNKIKTISDIYYNYNIHENSVVRSEYNFDILANNERKIFEFIYGFLAKTPLEVDLHRYLNIMLFTKKFVPLTKGYKKAIKNVNLLLKESERSGCKKHLEKIDFAKYDYCFAKSYFNHWYKIFVYPLITFDYFVHRLLKK